MGFNCLCALPVGVSHSIPRLPSSRFSSVEKEQAYLTLKTGWFCRLQKHRACGRSAAQFCRPRTTCRSAAYPREGAGEDQKSVHQQQENEGSFPRRGALDLREWRDYRAHLLEQEYSKQGAGMHHLRVHRGHNRWCHRIAAAEPGCLLLANQPNLGFFERAVMLIVSTHSQHGSVGLMLNRPSAITVQDMPLNSHIMDCFQTCDIQIGGYLRHTSLFLLHGQRQVWDANEVAPGVLTGGMATAAALIEQGACQPDDFCLFAGYAGWSAGQLEVEVGEGQWIALAAAPDIIMGIAQHQERSQRAWHDLFSFMSQKDRTYDAGDTYGMA